MTTLTYNFKQTLYESLLSYKAFLKPINKINKSWKLIKNTTNLNIPVNSPVPLHPHNIWIPEAWVHGNVVPTTSLLQFLVAAVQLGFDELARFAREHFPRVSVLIVIICWTVWDEFDLIVLGTKVYGFFELKKCLS